MRVYSVYGSSDCGTDIRRDSMLTFLATMAAIVAVFLVVIQVVAISIAGYLSDFNDDD